MVQFNKENPEIQVGNFEYVNDAFCLGRLSGNRFAIVVRNVDVTDEIINANVKSASEYGFINYFGLQRFGTSDVSPTHKIGIHLFKNEWKEAANAILFSRYDPQGTDRMNEAIKHFVETQDAEGAVQKCPRTMSIERNILVSYSKNGLNDHMAAISHV